LKENLYTYNTDYLLHPDRWTYIRTAYHYLLVVRKFRNPDRQFAEALLTSIMEIIIAFYTLHISNILAAISGSLAKIMLGKNNSSVHPDTLDEQKYY
jgi:hypothetical protein